MIMPIPPYRIPRLPLPLPGALPLYIAFAVGYAAASLSSRIANRAKKEGS